MSRTSTTARAALLTACLLGSAPPVSAQPAPSAPPGPPASPASPAFPAQFVPPPGQPPAQGFPPGPPGQPLFPPPPGQTPPFAPAPPLPSGWQSPPAPQVAPDPHTVPEPLEPAAPPAGMTRHRLPITRRGHISLETSTLELTAPVYDGYGYSSSLFVTGVALEASARVTGGMFASVRYASAGLSLPGNLMGGADYIVTLGRGGTWLTIGGALGVPLAQGDPALSRQYYGLTGAGWNQFEYMNNIVPVRIDAGFEMVRGDLGLRVDLQPVVLMPFDQLSADPQLLVQHAVEVQYGHTFGVGLRLQGVANSYSPDAYQAAVEPFVVLRRELGFARLGLLKTLDEENYFYNEAWGMRFSAGINID